MRLTLATIVVFMLSNMPAPLYASWENSLGFDAATTSALFSAYQGGVLVGLLLLGRFVDRLGWRISLTAAALVMAGGAVAFALADQAMALGLGRLLSGFGVGIFLSCGAAAITASREALNKHDGPAIATLAVSSGLSLGPLTSGVVVGLQGVPLQVLFAIHAFVLMGAGLLTFQSVPSTFGPRVRRTDSGVVSKAESVRVMGAALATTVMVITGVICAIYLGIASSYLYSQLGSSTTIQTGLLIALVFAAALGGQLLLRARSTGVTALWSLIFGVGAAALLVAGVLLMSVLSVFASAILSGCSQGTGQLAGVTAIRDVTAPSRRRRGYGLAQAWAYGLSGVVVLLVGWVSRITDLVASLAGAAVMSGIALSVVGAVVAIRLLRLDRRSAQ